VLAWGSVDMQTKRVQAVPQAATSAQLKPAQPSGPIGQQQDKPIATATAH
jgi:hypothetical protein